MTITLPDPTTIVQWVGYFLGGLGWIVALAWRSRRRPEDPAKPRAASEDLLTLLAAGIATAVSAQGMWQFFTRIMPGVDWPWRLVMFAFIEVAVITSAIRARRNMRERHAAGVDGLAVWALTCLSAVLSTLEARSFAEHVFRLAAPLVAAWLWERGMAIERIRLTGRARIHWRITPERIFVRLGLAEPSERTAGEVDAMRRLTKVALAAGRFDDARWSALRVMRARALKRKGRAMLAHTAVATNPQQREYLRAVMAVDRHITRLPEAAGRPFWEPAVDTRPHTPVVTSRAVEVTGAASNDWPDLMLDDEPDTDTDLDTELLTLLHTPNGQADAQSGDQSEDRERPDEQDNRTAEAWIRAQCRGRDGIGRRPSHREVADKYGFSPGWGGLRVRAVQDRMSAQGYQFQANGVVLGPGVAVTVNGSTEESS
jgi:hypothetical protein